MYRQTQALEFWTFSKPLRKSINYMKMEGVYMYFKYH